MDEKIEDEVSQEELDKIQVKPELIAELEDEDKVVEKWHGRCKLTDEVQSKIVNAIKRGNFITVACALAGVDRTTYYKWCVLGHQRPNGRYGQFVEAVSQANAECEDRLVNILSDAAMQGDTDAAKHILKCKAAKRWNPKERQQVETQPAKIEVEFVNECKSDQQPKEQEL